MARRVDGDNAGCKYDVAVTSQPGHVVADLDHGIALDGTSYSAIGEDEDMFLVDFEP